MLPSRPSVRAACVCALALVFAGLTGVTADAQVRREGGVTWVVAHTEPEKRLELKFVNLGVVDKVAVKKGDVVKAGQLLMAQDQEIEALELERLKAEAESMARIEFAEADLGVKRQVLKRKEEIYRTGAGSESELEEARLDVVSREKSLEIARHEQAQNQIKHQQQQAKVTRMNLLSPVNGVVEKIEVWEGEMADPSNPAIVLVTNDPARVIIRDLTTRQVARLQLGEELEVKYPEQTTWQKAKIVYIAPVADAASDRQDVELEKANPDNRATGLEVQVKLPAKLIEADPAAAAAPAAALNR